MELRFRSRELYADVRADVTVEEARQLNALLAKGIDTLRFVESCKGTALAFPAGSYEEVTTS